MKKDVETLCEDVVSNDERIFLGCAVNSNIYRLFTNGTQSINAFQIEMNPHEYEDLISLVLMLSKLLLTK